MHKSRASRVQLSSTAAARATFCLTDRSSSLRDHRAVHTWRVCTRQHSELCNRFRQPDTQNKKDIFCSVGPLWAIWAADCIWKWAHPAAPQHLWGHTPPSAAPYGGKPEPHQCDYRCRGRREKNWLLRVTRYTHTPSTQIYSATVLAPVPRFLSFAVLGVFEHLQPLDVVLWLLGDELDPLQDIGYVVDASLLNIEHLRRPVQIHHAVGRLGQQVQKALGGQVQRSVIPRLLCRGPRNWAEREYIQEWKEMHILLV